MTYRYIFTVYPKGLRESVYRIFEFSGEERLDTLGDAILDSFEIPSRNRFQFVFPNHLLDDPFDSIFSFMGFGRHRRRNNVPTNESVLGTLPLDRGVYFDLQVIDEEDWHFLVEVVNLFEEESYSPFRLLSRAGDIELNAVIEEEWEEEIQEWEEED